MSPRNFFSNSATTSVQRLDSINDEGLHGTSGGVPGLTMAVIIGVSEYQKKAGPMFRDVKISTQGVHLTFRTCMLIERDKEGIVDRLILVTFLKRGKRIKFFLIIREDVGTLSCISMSRPCDGKIRIREELSKEQGFWLFWEGKVAVKRNVKPIALP